jgi:hypothetical protein
MQRAMDAARPPPARAASCSSRSTAPS